MVVMALTIAGCKKADEKKTAAPADPKLDAYLTATKAKLANLEKIRAQVKAAPALKKDALSMPSKGPFTLISSNQIPELGNCFEDAMVCDDPWWVLSACDRFAKETRAELVESGAEAVLALKKCSELRYLAVARKTAWKAPVVTLETKSYDGGELSADVFVFDIDSAKYIGGFKASAKTPDTLEKVSDRNSSKDVEKWLLRIVGSDLLAAVKQKVE
jgi:hypothetical protein